MEFTRIEKKAKLVIPGYAKLDGHIPAYIIGYIEAGKRLVPRASTRLSLGDRMGGIAVRWAIRRNNYRVVPGLYAVGDPDRSSPVLVTANYKLSFDSLRKELEGIDAWIVVLDTKGVNVWCAAGKGTFGTAELLDKIAALKLEDIVSHKLLILPQLGATGISAPEIARVSRFRVAWGPVRASDLPAYLAAGMKKTEAMRRVEFRLADRMSVAPIELVHSWPFILASLLLSALAALPIGSGYGNRLAWLLAATLGSIMAGALAFPALLPFLPTKAFSIKGAILGAAWGILCAIGAASSGPFGGGMGYGLGAALVLLCAPVASFIGLNFTGSSTFTCQSGANLEVKKAILPTVASLALSLCLGSLSRVFGF